MQATQEKRMVNLEDKRTIEQAKVIAIKYLEKGNFKIVAQDYTSTAGVADYVFYEKDDLVFASVGLGDNEGNFPEHDCSSERKAAERIALDYFTSHPHINSCRVRFDNIDVCFAGPSGQQAMVKHHRDAYSTDDDYSPIG
ncbi:MAG: hypothetical protein LBL67_04280 [Coriobacteriales bacterium]|jgi:Holliday junction resolvase-like predicted endonuclease|nr:hypothetical protein [Coriobacteriales bacterium]